MENLNLNLPPFYVGQRVIYITGRNLPKNSIHVVRQCYQMPCGCWMVDIGKCVETADRYFCGKHKDSERFLKPIKNLSYFCAKSFAPIEERFISYADVIAKESPLTCVN